MHKIAVAAAAPKVALEEMDENEFWKLPDSARRGRLQEYITGKFMDPEYNPVKEATGADISPEKVIVNHEPGGDDFDDYYVYVIFPVLPPEQAKALIAAYGDVSGASEVLTWSDDYGYNPYHEERLNKAMMNKGRVVYCYAFQSTGRSIDQYDEYPGRD